MDQLGIVFVPLLLEVPVGTFALQCDEVRGLFLDSRLKTANKAYEWILDKEITLKSGFSHTLKLTMGNDVVLTTKESITAKPWDNGTKPDSTLETE